MFYLELHVHGRDPMTEPLMGERWCVGRSADNDIVISDPYTSGYHAVLTRRGSSLHFQDVGSRHGSFVRRDGNWVRIEGAHRLDDGDVVLVGRTRLRCVQRVERQETIAKSVETMPGMMTAIGIDGGEMLSNATGMDTRMLRDLFALAVGMNRAEDVDAVFRQVCQCIWARMTDVVGVQLHLSGGGAERVLAMGRRVQTPPPRVPEPVRVFAESSGQMIVYHPDDVAGDFVDADVGPDQRPLLVSPLCVAGHTLGTLAVVTAGPNARPGASHQRALAMIAELASASLDRLTVQADTDLVVETLALLPVRAVERFTGDAGGYCERVADMAERLLHVVTQSGRSDWQSLVLPRPQAARLRVSALLYALHVVCSEVTPHDATLPGADIADAMEPVEAASGLLYDVTWPSSIRDAVDAARLALTLRASPTSVSASTAPARSTEAMAVFLVVARACTPRWGVSGRDAAHRPAQAVQKLVQDGLLSPLAHEIVLEMLGLSPAPITSNISVLPAPAWGDDTPTPGRTGPRGLGGPTRTEGCGVVRPVRATTNHRLTSKS